MFEFPFTANPPLIAVGTFTTNPLFGEIFAIAEPDFICDKSPIALASMLNKPLPSPLNKDADTTDVTFTEPVN